MIVTHENGVLTVQKTIKKKTYEASMPLSNVLKGRKAVMVTVLENWIDRFAKGDTSVNVKEI